MIVFNHWLQRSWTLAVIKGPHWPSIPWHKALNTVTLHYASDTKPGRAWQLIQLWDLVASITHNNRTKHHPLSKVVSHRLPKLLGKSKLPQAICWSPRLPVKQARFAYSLVALLSSPLRSIEESVNNHTSKVTVASCRQRKGGRLESQSRSWDLSSDSQHLCESSEQ